MIANELLIPGPDQDRLTMSVLVRMPGIVNYQSKGHRNIFIVIVNICSR